MTRGDRPKTTAAPASAVRRASPRYSLGQLNSAPDSKTHRRGPGTRWQPGQSGNPLGSPPRELSIAATLRRIGEELVEVKGRREKVKRLELVLRNVYAQALAGQPWAVQFIADRTEGRPLSMVEMDARVKHSGTLDVKNMSLQELMTLGATYAGVNTDSYYGDTAG